MLQTRDFVMAIECVKKLIEATDHDHFVDILVREMLPIMRARVAGYNEADPVRKRFGFVIHPREFVTDERISAWVTHAHENPILMHVQKNKNDTSVYKITDFVPQAQFRKTNLCRQVYATMGAEYQIAMPLLLTGTASIAVVFNREDDFDDRDRELLTLLQPLISTAYMNVQRMGELQMAHMEVQAAKDSRKSERQALLDKLSLSDRQSDVLAHLVQGKSNKQIADQLKLSIRTVEKYVETLLRKLKLRTRARAIAKYQHLFSVAEI